MASTPAATTICPSRSAWRNCSRACARSFAVPPATRSSVVTAGDITLDERQMSVSLRGVPVALSPLEYRLVAYLMKHRGRVVSQHELDENVYGHGEEHDSNALEVLIGRVRRKLGPDLIETRRGFGYLVPEQRRHEMGFAAAAACRRRDRRDPASRSPWPAAASFFCSNAMSPARLAEDLDVHLKQLLAGVDVDPQGNLVITRPPADPRFADPLSGLYWQVSDDRGQLLRSRSLWDTSLALPIDELPPGQLHHHEILGPAHARLLVAERSVFLTVGGRRMPVRVAVAADLGRVSQAAIAFGRDMVVALGLLGLVLAVATSIQVGLGLRPLDALRRGVADIRSGRRQRLPVAVPVEVKPLVEEVNALLDAQDQEIERSRSRAADLAHGLKTPLAALAADAARLRKRGEAAIAQDIEAVGDAMSRHVDRELALTRAAARPGNEAAAPPRWRRSSARSSPRCHGPPTAARFFRAENPRRRCKCRSTAPTLPKFSATCSKTPRGMRRRVSGLPPIPVRPRRS